MTVKMMRASFFLFFKLVILPEDMKELAHNDPPESADRYDDLEVQVGVIVILATDFWSIFSLPWTLEDE